MSFHDIIGRLLNLENVKSVDQIRPSLAAPWARQHPSWVLFGCLVLAAIALGFYARLQPKTHGHMRWPLAVMRGLTLIALLMILAEPVLTVSVTDNPRPLLWVLFDGSDSMGIADELTDTQREQLGAAVGIKPSATLPSASDNPDKVTKLARIDYVKAWIAKNQDNVLNKLQEKFRLKGFIFERADGVRSLNWTGNVTEKVDTTQASGQLTTTGQVTAIGKALDDLAMRHATSNLAGVVVVSDFDQNSGPPPLAKAQSLRVPLYTVGVGPTAALDLAVDLQAPPLMKKAERSTVTVTLRQSGLPSETVQVRVTARPLGGAGDMMSSAISSITVGEKQVQLQSSVTPIEFPFTPEETGRFEFIAEVPPITGEVVEQNNRVSREVNIRDDFLRLMYVEYEPTWEWRFIKEVFHRDKLVGTRGFRTFLRSSDPKVRISNELFLPTLTPQRSEFFAQDVIFLGDMPSTTLNPRFCEMLKEFVDKFGGGLVVIAGPRFGSGQLAATSLADMLPVVVDPDARLQDQRQFRLQLSPEAQQIDFMQLGSGGEEENRKAWDNLGALPWYQPVARKHPLGTVLAQHPSDTCVDGKTPQPLIAIRQYGAGQVVYLGFNETWRLRRKYGELYYRQFWGQMIHRLGLSHALGSQKRFVVRTDRDKYQADDKVTIKVEAYDANFEPLSDEKLADHKLLGEMLAPPAEGEVAHAQPITIPQLREGVFETQIPVFNGGEHRLRVKDPITGEHTEVAFQVTSLSAERRSAVRNVALQEELARATGGKSYDLTTASRLVDDIRTDTISETSIRIFPLASTWVCFVLVTVLMLGEWLARKWGNLP